MLTSLSSGLSHLAGSFTNGARQAASALQQQARHYTRDAALAQKILKDAVTARMYEFTKVQEPGMCRQSVNASLRELTGAGKLAFDNFTLIEQAARPESLALRMREMRRDGGPLKAVLYGITPNYYGYHVVTIPAIYAAGGKLVSVLLDGSDRDGNNPLLQQMDAAAREKGLPGVWSLPPQDRKELDPNGQCFLRTVETEAMLAHSMQQWKIVEEALTRHGISQREVPLLFPMPQLCTFGNSELKQVDHAAAKEVEEHLASHPELVERQFFQVDPERVLGGKE